ncbi:MAG: hypothetical protein QM784_12425 [Polyangiaceae bacterium]
MTNIRLSPKTMLAVAMIVVGGVGSFRIAHGQVVTASAWTALELLLAMSTSGLISLLGLATTGHRSARGLDLAVSRALEVTAALPTVVACAIAVVTLGWKTAIAVAVVTGALNGLRSLRLLTLARSTAPGRIQLARRIASLRQALLASQSELLPQLFGLEAAIEYLGFLEGPNHGGLGVCVAAALSRGNPYEIIVYCLLCTGLVLLTRAETHRTTQPTTLAPSGPTTPR